MARFGEDFNLSGGSGGGGGGSGLYSGTVEYVTLTGTLVGIPEPGFLPADGGSVIGIFTSTDGGPIPGVFLIDNSSPPNILNAMQLEVESDAAAIQAVDNSKNSIAVRFFSADPNFVYYQFPTRQTTDISSDIALGVPYSSNEDYDTTIAITLASTAGDTITITIQCPGDSSPTTLGTLTIPPGGSIFNQLPFPNSSSITLTAAGDATITSAYQY